MSVCASRVVTPFGKLESVDIPAELVPPSFRGDGPTVQVVYWMSSLSPRLRGCVTYAELRWLAASGWRFGAGPSEPVPTSLPGVVRGELGDVEVPVLLGRFRANDTRSMFSLTQLSARFAELADQQGGRAVASLAGHLAGQLLVGKPARRRIAAVAAVPYVARFEVLDPRPGADNSHVFDSDRLVIGLEVTDPELASRCAINIDPQHGGVTAHTDEMKRIIRGSGFLPDSNFAACQAANALGEAGLWWHAADAVLVTSRTDLDSVAAAAVLTGQAMGFSMKSWLKEIGDRDGSRQGLWSPETAKDVTFKADTLSALSAVCADRSKSFGEKVQVAFDALTGGKSFEPELAQHRRRLRARLAEAERVPVKKFARGCAAWVDSTLSHGTSAGYLHAPIVVAHNPEFVVRDTEPHHKYTIGAWSGGLEDFDGSRLALGGLVAELNRAEHRRAVELGRDDLLSEDRSSLRSSWGGQSHVVGSPQGRSPLLNAGEIREIVERWVVFEVDDGWRLSSAVRSAIGLL